MTPTFDLHHDTLPADAAAVVDAGIGAFNDAFAPLAQVRRLGVFARDSAGRVLGGAVGRTWGNRAELQQLWVDEVLRGLGLGRALLQRFEAGAAEQGARHVELETFSFQAPGFYRRLGYAPVHEVRGFGGGAIKWLMQRTLPGPPSPVSRTTGLRVYEVAAGQAGAAERAALANLLTHAVQGGASVGYTWPLPPTAAAEWADGVCRALSPGLRLWLAERGGTPVGTVQLGPVLKANGRHRGEVMKLLVAPAARGQGVARALMQALEDAARAAGLTLLVLDTEAGSDADPIYRHLGWQHFGIVPGHSVSPDGRPHDTAYLFKRLS